MTKARKLQPHVRAAMRKLFGIKSKRFRDRALTFTESAIVDEYGYAVMMDWERDIMHKHVDLVTFEGADVLEIGFGMAISATRIQESKPRSHTIAECHPDVLVRLREWAKDRPSVKILEGEWFERRGDFERYDAIWYDPYEDPHEKDFFAGVDGWLKSGGKFTFYNQLAKPRNKHGLDCTYVEVPVNPDPNDYHNAKRYYIPLYEPHPTP